MLRADNLSKWRGTQLLFEHVSFLLNAGERAGLVGNTGSGKTTLLRILAGLEKPNTGSIYCDPGEILGYLPDSMDYYSSEKLRTVLESARGELPATRARMRAIEDEMSGDISADRLAKLMREYEDTGARFEALGGYEIDSQVERVLQGLDLGDIDLDSSMQSLSGGQKIKLGLARLLLINPSILFLDEPTNSLDLPSLLWLEKYLRECRATMLIVSQDRRFLDKVVEQVIELDAYRKTTVVYIGTFSNFQTQKSLENQRWKEAYKDQQEAIKVIQKDIMRLKQQAQQTESMTHDSKSRRYSKKVAKKAKVRELRLRKLLNSDGKIEPPPDEVELNLHLTGATPEDAEILELSGIHLWYGTNHVLSDVSMALRGKDRVALLGRNGAGKTTLLRVITGELAPDGGSVWMAPEIRLGYLPQEPTEADIQKTVLDDLRRAAPIYEDEAIQVLLGFLFTEEDVIKKVKDLSPGARARLSMAKMMIAGANLLVLDEPTSHLDLRSLDAMESAVSQFAGAIILVSHDRYFVSRIGVNQVLLLEHGSLHHFPGGYSEYEEGLLKRVAG